MPYDPNRQFRRQKNNTSYHPADQRLMRGRFRCRACDRVHGLIERANYIHKVIEHTKCHHCLSNSWDIIYIEEFKS